jgi:hypothetical protein
MQAREEAVVALFECMERYLEARERLHAAIKAGHLSLARSKYGIGGLGMQQYPADMRACAWVGIRAGSPVGLELQRGEYPGAGQGTQHAQGDSGSSSDGDDDLNAAIQAELAGRPAAAAPPCSAAVRRPRPRSSASAAVWFSGMPPSTLKQTASDFSSSATLAVEVAALALQLSALTHAAATQQQACAHEP